MALIVAEAPGLARAPDTVSPEAEKVPAIPLFLAFASAYFFSALIRAITATLAPTLVQEFTLTASDLGLLSGGYFFGFSMTQLPLGAWLDRFGPKRVLLAFLTVAVIGCLCFAAADSFWTLCAARVACGVGLSACLMAPLTAYRRWYRPDNQQRASSWMLMTGSLGFVASTLPVQWLMPVLGWRGIFGVLAALLLLAISAVASVVPRWPAPTAASAAPDDAPGLRQGAYAAVFRHPYFRSLTPFGFFAYGGMVAMQTLWAARWLTAVAGYTPEQAASGMFWLNAGMMAAFLAWGAASPWLARRGWTSHVLMQRLLPVSLLVLLAIVLGGPAYGQSSAWMWTVYCVCASVVTLSQPAVGLAFPAHLAGRALSAFNLVIFSGVFTVQWGLGLVIDALLAAGLSVQGAYQGAVAVSGICSLLAYAYFLVAKKS
jgi:predicted MFS family arabinose efflux permease